MRTKDWKKIKKKTDGEVENLERLLLYTRLKGHQSLRRRCKRTKYKGISSVWTAGNEDPMHEVCISHSIPSAWKQQG